MISIFSLWLPILLSAVFVFIISSLIHMLLPYHKNDFGKVPNEDGVMEALRKFDIPPGEYAIPNASSSAAMKDPEFKAEAKKLKVDIRPVSGEEIQKLINEAFSMPKSVIQRTKKILGTK